jgi:4a-hydroxytetrahydrobiopterin dehydratase
LSYGCFGKGYLAEDGEGVKCALRLRFSLKKFCRKARQICRKYGARKLLAPVAKNLRDVGCTSFVGCYSFGVMAELIKADQLKIRLKKIPEWELEKKHIERTFEFDDFTESIDFVNAVAEVSEDEEHHPDIDIRYNKVRLVLSTHSKGGLTDLDFQLAERIDTLSE